MDVKFIVSLQWGQRGVLMSFRHVEWYTVLQQCV